MIFGLTAALGWGLADFFGALAGRRIGSIGTVMSGQLLSAVFMTVVLVATGTSVAPLGPDVWLVVLNGAAAAFAYLTHYKALELGPVAVVSPIGAGYAVVGVALAIVILGERPSGLALIGAAIAVVGVALVSTDLRKLRDGIENHLPGLPWAIAAAIGFGVAGFLLGWISDRAGWIAGLWGSRVAQIAFFLPARRGVQEGARPGCAPVSACGSRSSPAPPTSSAWSRSPSARSAGSTRSCSLRAPCSR